MIKIFSVFIFLYLFYIISTEEQKSANNGQRKQFRYIDDDSEEQHSHLPQPRSEAQQRPLYRSQEHYGAQEQTHYRPPQPPHDRPQESPHYEHQEPTHYGPHEPHQPHYDNGVKHPHDYKHGPIGVSVTKDQHQLGQNVGVGVNVGSVFI